uniref:Mitochondrial fission process protein 1 n=1 Tax=Helicotheca tamesis TaxID=374047 RepID=A0A7S2MFK8_9STRA|eukprot:CAMPEP_0185734472 /NCGR_PEP_ID=MMETSP1171-20130828/22593_1 /TAXON_ID=374046 /ORGANISM="Helicotheca tamensis, Strain CCMP826" /LENGTH=210 /DNA_ID=CAMNT_0028404473 /DNA_START=6 /DNA_END=638 /DNA_ORIENTATION=-
MTNTTNSAKNAATVQKKKSLRHHPTQKQQQQQQDGPATEIGEDQYNIFRDSPLRYMGYANEIGESFRYQFPKFVVPSYILAFGYCGMDALSAGYRVWKQPPKSFNNGTSLSSSKEAQIAIATFDTLLWQSLASVMIPGATINLLVKASRLTVSRTIILPTMLSKWAPTGVGLGSIPFIVHPIDTAVDYALDNSVRLMIFGEKNNENETKK